MKKLRLKNWIKIAGIIVLSAAILLLAFQQFLKLYVPKIIRSQINHLVVTGSDSLYTCSIGKISVDLFTGSVIVNDLDVSIDSVRYREREKLGKLPNLIFKIRLKTGMIKGLKLYPLVFRNKTIVRTILADGADISFSRKTMTRNSKPKPPPSESELWRMIKPHIKGIYIERILLDHIKLSYKSNEKDMYVNFSYESCSASFKNIRIDSTGTQNSSRLLFTEELTFRLTGVHYLTPDSIYLMKVDTLTYVSFLKKLRVQGFSIHPTISPEEITRRHGMQVDVLDMDLPEVRINNFKVERIITNGEIYMDTILVQEPLIHIHRDRTAHFDTTSQIGKFPLELLATAPMYLRVPVIIIDDAEIHYLEKQKVSHLIGDAGFQHVSGTILNISNYPDDIEKHGHAEISLKGFFMKSAKLEVRVDFDLRSPQGKYEVNVDLGRMESGALNELVIPFAGVRMKELVIHEGHFSLTGDNTGTVGSVAMRYQNLKMEVLKINPATGEIKTNDFISFMANMVAVRPNNPNGKKEIIITGVAITRKRRQPFSHIILETFVEGAKKLMVKVPTNNIKLEM